MVYIGSLTKVDDDEYLLVDHTQFISLDALRDNIYYKEKIRRDLNCKELWYYFAWNNIRFH